MSTVDREMILAPLADGQQMHRAEFHERYEAMPPDTRAELIGGVVVMGSPLGYRHGRKDINAGTWLNLYKFRTPGVEALHNASAALDDLGEPQPDVTLRILPEYGGQSHNLGKIIGGAPELVVEVADSSRAIDLGAKRLDYERAGVLEYVVIALDPEEVFWHVRRDGRLVRVEPDADGLYRSAVFPGLWLDPRALLADDGRALVEVLERGLATPEHAAFVADLAGRAR
jgi:Uma2 family endonuclease